MMLPISVFQILKPLSASAGVIASLLFIYATKEHDMLTRLVTKPWPVVAMIVALLESVWNSPKRFNIAILIALVFCLIGDVCLEYPEMFTHGLLAFLTGHLGYIYAFTKVALVKTPLLYIPFFMYGFIFYYVVYDALGGLKIPVLFYTLILGLMSGGAGATFDAVRGKFGAKIGLMIPIGAALFVFSDSMIAINKFYATTSTHVLKYVIIITYWLGQLLLSWGSLRIAASIEESKPAEVKEKAA